MAFFFSRHHIILCICTYVVCVSVDDFFPSLKKSSLSFYYVSKCLFLLFRISKKIKCQPSNIWISFMNSNIKMRFHKKCTRIFESVISQSQINTVPKRTHNSQRCMKFIENTPHTKKKNTKYIDMSIADHIVLYTNLYSQVDSYIMMMTIYCYYHYCYWFALIWFDFIGFVSDWAWQLFSCVCELIKWNVKKFNHFETKNVLVAKCWKMPIAK